MISLSTAGTQNDIIKHSRYRKISLSTADTQNDIIKHSRYTQ